MSNPTPLPMTAFEEYMTLDSSAAYPMDCHYRLRFSGAFQHEDFERAMLETLRKHPLLYATAEETRRGRFAWKWNPVQELVSGADFSQILGVKVFWIAEKCRGAFPEASNQAVDIFQEAVLRVFVVEERNEQEEIVRTDLIFKFHHSAADALGFARFMADLLVEYARNQGVAFEGWNEMLPIDASQLSRRGWFGRKLGFWLGFCNKMRLMDGARGRWCLLRRLLSVAKCPALPESLPKDYPAMRFRILPEEESGHWVRACRELGVTLNDVLLQATWETARRWRVAHPECAQTGDAWSRIAVPTNLRAPGMENFPAANIVSMVFLDRKEVDVNTSRAFLDGVHREMDTVKRRNLGFLLILGMMDFRFVLRNLRWIIGVRDCWASMVVTNLGNFFSPKFLPFPRTEDGKIRVGDLILDEVEAASPIRPKTAISICAATYAKRMNLSLMYDAQFIPAGAAEDFLNTLKNVVGEILEQNGPDK